MDEQVNNALWRLSRKSTAISNPLVDEIKVDVAIVGGGFTGTSAALRLAEAGTDVALVEAQYNGYGGSGRNVGLTNAGLWRNPDDIDAEIGSEYGNRLHQFLSKAPNLVHNIINKYGIECDALRNGTLHLAHSAAGLKAIERRALQINARGGSVMVLDRDETYKLTRAENYLGAIHDMRAGTIQPLEYCHGLTLAAQKTGAKIYTKTPAINISHISGKWHVKTPEGLVIADKVLMATNAYLEQVMPELKATFTPLYYCQMATDSLKEDQLKNFLPGKNGAWDTRMVMRSYRTDAKGRLIIGTIGNIFKPDAPLFVSWADKMIRDTFSGVGSVRWKYKWAGRIACTKNHIPNLNDLGSGLYNISGYSGRGIAPGTAFGRVMADYLLGKVSADDLPLPLTPAKNVPFNKIRELFFEGGSQLTRLYDHL